MTKKAKTRRKTKRIMTRKKLETQIQRTEQTFLHRLRQVMEESCDENSNNSSRVLLHTRNTLRKSSLSRVPAFSHTNVRTEDTRDSYTCYRCQHFLEIPRNLSQPFSNRISPFVKRCKMELSFIQAIVWLKSAIAYASHIPVEQLQQIFDRQWSTRDERLKSPVNRDLSVSEKTNARDICPMSVPLDISDVPCVTPQRTILYARSEDTRSKSVSANDPNQSLVESLILKSSNSCYIPTGEKKKEVRASIIPETDVESILSEDLNMFDGMPEHQCFEFERDPGCSIQSASKSGIEQINKKIIENKHIRKSHADVPNKRKSMLPERNQSIDPMFDLENNFDGECFTSMRSQHNLADKVLESNGSPKSFTITQKDVSQMSNVNNDEYCEFLFDDTCSWQVSNSTAGNSHKDSAYSTSRNDIFNYDTVVQAGPIASYNKRLSDIEYEMQPCKKKTITHETEVSFSTNRILTCDDSSKSLIITEIEDNDENFEFQIVSSYDEQMSDISTLKVSNSKSLEDDGLATESINDKCTSNIEHCYELHPCHEKTVTREKMTASAFITQGTVKPDVEHCYNLTACNDRRISHEKEAPSTIGGPEKRNSGRAWNLLETENENEDKMISADWLNFTLESLHIEHVIVKSVQVILSTLCDKKTVEEYVVKEQRRNARNYWKGSLEEEAVNAVLNISDIFTTEKKPNICIKVIMTAIVRTLNEMTMRAQLNKIYYTETSMWIYRVRIILEFCNSLPICIKITDHLITRLKSLQSVLTKVEKIQTDTYIMINQLHLVFYALNITLRKYRTIIPSDHRSRSAEKLIPHIADLWKIHYIDKELEYTGLDLDAAEKRWLNALENSAVVFTKHFVQFAEKSLSLVHVLISRSSTRIT